MRLAIVVLAISIAISSTAAAQEDGPIILPDRLQQLATEFPVAERLHISWAQASLEDIGRYVGLLSAVNEVANSIALKNDRKAASDDDYRAAFSVFCFWPVNKPPLAEPFWNTAAEAYGSEKVRMALGQSIGPLAVALPEMIKDGSASDEVLKKWPQTKAEYMKYVIDLESLKNAK
ncbi:hypothetical protein [Mesorhizobium sp. WSM3868]|uniref:hypothetical protein n=1 Tax=Mesorhizobium sp. WSM3868 TaxID=2029405 RepID=UPI000BAFA6EE|nr:hypothetical protein [Mesorhizobium sp. WSM3868]PBB36890.1 hypothetical protein CK221_15140 [Mesorhizobium sp. WSM3868]